MVVFLAHGMVEVEVERFHQVKVKVKAKKLSVPEQIQPQHAPDEKVSRFTRREFTSLKSRC